jgi:hypothetical protein
MPNGFARPFVFFLMGCARYRMRFGEWPTRIALAPAALWELAEILEEQDFDRVCQRVEFRTLPGGPREEGEEFMFFSEKRGRSGCRKPSPRRESQGS